MQSRHLFVSSIIPMLAACGGSGDSSLGGGDLPGPAEFNALVLEADAQAEKLDTLIATETLPTDNGVVFSGVFLAVESLEEPGNALVSAMTLTVNFGGMDLTGDASDFYLVSVDAEGGATGPTTAVSGDLDFASTNVSTGGFDIQITGDVFFEESSRVASGDAVAALFGQTSTDVDIVTFLGLMDLEGTDTDLLAIGTAD